MKKSRELELLSMLEEWLELAEDQFGEFDIEDEDDCPSDAKLCPKCESNGCIQRKIRKTRELLLQDLALTSSER